jgi:hypothetical protein
MKLPRLLLVVLPLAACAPGSTSSGPGDAPASTPASAGDVPTEQLLPRISRAPEHVAYHGTRRVKMRYRVVGIQQDLEYVERVFADGEGRFGIDVVDVVSPAMTPDRKEFFELLQDNRQGFFYRYRDFRIHDLNLFREGYEVRVTGRTTVCERECVELVVHRRERPNRSYRIAVDPRTGLVLRSEEFAGERLVSSVCFEEFAEGLPAAETGYYSGLFERSGVDPSRPGRPQVGFPILRPTLVPEGYRLETADSLEDRGRTWVRLVYGDGVEQVFFLHSPEPRPSRPSEVERDPLATVSAERRADRVTVAHVGPWTVLDGSVNGQGIVAMGKVSEEELLQMVQSAVETRSDG